MEIKKCCVIGHRDIPADKIDRVKQELRMEALQAIEDGYTHFISGFAKGVDLMFAAIVVELKRDNNALTLEAAIPYRTRLKSHDRLFQYLLSQCDKDNIIVHSEAYSPGCFMKRNRYMVSQSHRVIAVYDGREKGGTLFTVRCACTLEKELKIIRI